MADETRTPATDAQPGAEPGKHPRPASNTIDALDPLQGEAGIPNVATPTSTALSGKGLLALGLMAVSVLGVGGLAIHRFTAGSAAEAKPTTQLASTQPAAATAVPRRLEMPTPTQDISTANALPRVPALTPSEEGAVEPIGVRRTGAGAPAAGPPGGGSPEDAPVLLVSTRPGALTSAVGNAAPGAAPRPSQSAPAAQPPPPLDPNDPMAATTRNLQEYQVQLQGLLETLTRSAKLAGDTTPGASMGGPPVGGVGVGPSGTTLSALISTGPGAGTLPGAPGGALFGGQLASSQTPRATAGLLGQRSLTLPKGTAFTCALKTKIISATSGLVGCQVQRHVYSDDGRVLLIERGSHLDGEYRIGSVRPGMVRIPVLWTRIRTPLGVTVDIDSPGTGQLGESGIDGYVNNRWVERLGAAMLLSLIDDTVKLVIQNQANQSNDSGDTIVLPSTTSNASKLAEKVLDSTVNIPPLIYQNQGGIVGIYVARDVDFSSVYELRPTPMPTPTPTSTPTPSARDSIGGTPR